MKKIIVTGSRAAAQVEGLLEAADPSVVFVDYPTNGTPEQKIEAVKDAIGLWHFCDVIDGNKASASFVSPALTDISLSLWICKIRA